MPRSDTPIYDQLVDDFWPVLKVPPRLDSFAALAEALREVGKQAPHVVPPWPRITRHDQLYYYREEETE